MSKYRTHSNSHQRLSRRLGTAAEGSQSGCWLNVAYPGASVEMELVCDGKTFLAGRWALAVRLRGEEAKPMSPWKPTCWVSDNDGDYLELAIRLTGGLRVQRQLLMARQDRFLLLADAVLGDRQGKLDYLGALSLAAGVSFWPAADSREGRLVAGRRKATVLPLALPEWRCDPRPGELLLAARRLELRQTTGGRRLFAPLLVDLDHRRARRRLTWRQLTVAESLVVQPPDVAVGYRVAAGNQQWLIYRSLASKANRTVLGHNLATETLVARFQGGEVESIMEIE